jgi:hypothetical protein
VTLPRCLVLTGTADRLTLSGRVLPNIELQARGLNNPPRNI